MAEEMGPNPPRCALRWVALLALGLVAGCAKRASRKSENFEVRLLRADDLFARRADSLGALDSAIERYLGALAEEPRRRDVLARLARAYTLRSYGYPETGPRGFVIAREYGLACLKLQRSFTQRLATTGGVIDRRALGVLGPEDATCLVWTAEAWARWLHARGAAGAGIDLARLATLTSRGSQLARGMLTIQAQATEGLALGLGARAPGALPEGSLEAADASLTAALERAPARLTTRVDRAELVGLVTRPEVALQTLREIAAAVLDADYPDLLEDRRAQVRAFELLRSIAEDAD